MAGYIQEKIKSGLSPDLIVQYEAIREDNLYEPLCEIKDDEKKIGTIGTPMRKLYTQCIENLGSRNYPFLVRFFWGLVYVEFGYSEKTLCLRKGFEVAREK